MRTLLIVDVVACFPEISLLGPIAKVAALYCCIRLRGKCGVQLQVHQESHDTWNLGADVQYCHHRRFS